MEARTETANGGLAWRLWALVPIVLLALAVALVVSQGDRVVDLLGGTPPPADEFDVRRVEFREGEIRIQVRNPQPDDLTIASVTVDDAIVPFTLDGRLDIDNGSAERRLRPVASGRKAWLFAGSTAGAERFADLLSLVSTADAAGVNPGSYIADILPRIDTWPQRRLDELLPHAWATADEQLEQ